MRRAFLKAPLSFTRISSGFTLKRFHPIQKTWKAHPAIDYAAPTGTPIKTVGDGKIVQIGYTKGNVAEEAASMVEQLLETARSNDNPRAKAEGLAAAANVKAQIGKADEATALLEEAATVAREIERTESRAYALLAVGEATAESGDTATAKSVLDEAYAAADKVGDPGQRTLVMSKVSRALDRLK